jgi:capsular exopolysaccharide synthesis family protein
MNEISSYQVSPDIFAQSSDVSGSLQVTAAGLTLRDYWQVVRRHKRLIFKVWFACIGLTLAICLLVPPIFKASAVLLIQRQPPQVLDIQSQLVAPELPDADHDFYKTQIQILHSHDLAARVISKLDLANNGLFTGKSLTGIISSALRMWREAADFVKRLAGAAQPPPSDTYLRGVAPAAIANYEQMLSIEPLLETELVEIDFKSFDRGLAARIANAHAREYIVESQRLRSEPNAAAEHFLEGQLVELKERLAQSESRLNDFRRQRGIVDNLEDLDNSAKNGSVPNPADIAVARMASISNSLAEATAGRIQLEAEVLLLKKKDYDAVPEVVADKRMQDLHEQFAALQSQLAAMQAQFSPHYPKVAQLRAQVETLGEKLALEARSVVHSIEKAYAASVSRENRLNVQLRQEKEHVLKLHDAAVGYKVLSREVQTNQQLYDGVVERMKEFEVAAKANASNISIVDPAVAPLKPWFPKKWLSLAVGGVAGILFGLCAAFGVEYFNDRLETLEEMESYLRVPALGAIPQFQFQLQRRARIPISSSDGADYALLVGEQNQLMKRDTISMLTEAYRALHAAILLSRAPEPPRTILFTSALAGEGKSVTVLNTALTLREAGARVLVIDAQLRHSSCHRFLQIESGMGLSEVLTGQCALEDAIQHAGSVDLLRSGALPPNPAALLSSSRLRETFAAAASQYDFVLIDSAPLVPVSDALLFASAVEGVVMVVNSRNTPRALVRQSIVRLRRARTNLLGVVLNEVNPERESYSRYYSYSPLADEKVTVRSGMGSVSGEQHHEAVQAAADTGT